MRTPLNRRDFLRTAAGGAAAVPALLKLRPAWAQGKKVPVGSLLDKTGGINIYGLPAIAGTEQPQRPWVLYEFDDPALQSLSAGQRALLRMGPVNERRVKARLAEFRRFIAGEAARR